MQIQAILLLLVATVSAWVSILLFKRTFLETDTWNLSNASIMTSTLPRTMPSWLKAVIPTTSGDTAHLPRDVAPMERRGTPART